MSKVHYFVVAASLDENGKPLFVLDDELLVHLPGPVWDEDTEEWIGRGEIDEALDQELAYKLGEQLGK
jgi:hypothetical protein